MAALLILWTIFFVCTVSVFTRYLNQVRLKPRRIRSVLWKQGIRGPQPSFLFGNIAELEKIRSNAKITQKTLKGGHVQHDLRSFVHPFLHKWADEYGPVYLYSTGSQQHLVVSDPQLIRELMRLHNSMDLGRPPYMKKNFQALIGDSFLVVNGEKWAYERKIIAPEFFPHKVKDMFDLMVKSTTTTIMAWERSVQESDLGIVDMKVDEDFNAISREILSRACFSTSYSEGNQIFANISLLKEALSEPSVLFNFRNLRFRPTENDMKIKSLKKEVDALILKLARDSQVVMQHAGAPEKDLLQTVLNAADSTGMPAQLKSDSFVLDACKSIYFAGSESTATAVAWTLMLLSLHQEWQERIRAEIFKVCGDHDLHQCLQHIDTLPKLKTLIMVIQESLRLYPPAPTTAKHALADMKLGDLDVPEGTNIWIFTHRLQCDLENWGPDAYEFKPERFANGVSKSCKFTEAYVPFGFGNRICIGQNFAMTQMKIVLSLFLSKFSFSISPNYHHSPDYDMVLYPRHGIRLLVSLVQAEASC